MASLLLLLPHRAFAASDSADAALTATLSANGRLDVTDVRSERFTAGRHYITWRIFDNADAGSYGADSNVVSLGISKRMLRPADVNIVGVSVRKKGEGDFQPLERVEYNSRFMSDLVQDKEPEGQGWVFDAEMRDLYVFGPFNEEFEVMAQYYSESAVLFGSDCVYLPWWYCVNRIGGLGSCTLDLNLPVAPDAEQVEGQPLQGFVYADGDNYLTFEQKSASSGSSEASASSAAASTSASSEASTAASTSASSEASASSAAASSADSSSAKSGSTKLKDEAYFSDGMVHVTTKESFLQPPGVLGPAEGLCLNLVMPRSWFAEDAAGTAMTRIDESAPSYDDLVEANKTTVNEIAAMKSYRARQYQTPTKPRNNSAATAFNATLNGLAWIALIFLIGGFVLVLVLTGVEYAYMRRPDPRADVAPVMTNKVPDRLIHPLVFDELFYHEFDPEVRDFETELLRLAALGCIEVKTYGKGADAVPCIGGGEAQAFGPIDNSALGILFGSAGSDDQTLSSIKSRFSDDPRMIATMFGDWKKKVKEQADESSYMQEREPLVSKIGGKITGAYIFGSIVVAMVLGWLVLLLTLGGIALITQAKKAAKPRIVLTEEGARLCALGKGYCEWLEHASPEEILATDDERELADRLTYMAVFARDTWGPEKIAQVTALRPHDARMASVRACYCSWDAYSDALRLHPAAEEIADCIDDALTWIAENPTSSGPKPIADDKKPEKAAPAKDEKASGDFVPAMAATVATTVSSTDAEKKRLQAQRKVDHAKAELEKCKDELREAKEAKPPETEAASSDEREVWLKSVKQALPTIVIFVGFAFVGMLIIGATPAMFGMLLFGIMISLINVSLNFNKNSREKEKENIANEQARRRAEDRYAAQKDSVPLLEHKLAKCRKEYDQALEELRALEG